MYDYENLLRANIPLDRKSLCTGKPNTYGHCLLDFCRKNNIYIVNGRVGKDGLVGERTYKDTSLVDYFLASSKLFPNISEFEVLKFSPMFSDVHRQLHITLKCTGKDPQNPRERQIGTLISAKNLLIVLSRTTDWQTYVKCPYIQQLFNLFLMVVWYLPESWQIFDWCDQPHFQR